MVLLVEVLSELDVVDVPEELVLLWCLDLPSLVSSVEEVLLELDVLV